MENLVEVWSGGPFFVFDAGLGSGPADPANAWTLEEKQREMNSSYTARCVCVYMVKVAEIMKHFNTSRTN